MVQEYVDGPEFSVEGYASQGRIHALAITEKRCREHDAWIGSTLLARPDRAVAARVTTEPWGFLEGQEIL